MTHIKLNVLKKVYYGIIFTDFTEAFDKVSCSLVSDFTLSGSIKKVVRVTDGLVAPYSVNVPTSAVWLMALVCISSKFGSWSIIFHGVY